MGVRILEEGASLEHILTAFQAVDWIVAEMPGDTAQEQKIKKTRDETKARLENSALFTQLSRLELENHEYKEVSNSFGISEKETTSDFNLPLHTRPLNRFILILLS